MPGDRARPTFVSLPEELVLLILRSLTPRARARAGEVCRWLHGLAHDDQAWFETCGKAWVGCQRRESPFWAELHLLLEHPLEFDPLGR